MKIDFEALYRSHYRRVFGLCLRLLGRAPQAEDAVQEVFVRAYRALDKYDRNQPFATWIFGIAGNHCVDLLRRRTRDAQLFDDRNESAVEAESPAPAAIDAIADAERGAEIRNAIAALPEKYRVPLVLAYYRESSYDEIATLLGITRNHVGVLLLRAKRLLREALAAKEKQP